MSNYIQIEWTHGRPRRDANAREDKRRAIAAAEAVLDEAGVRAGVAWKAWQDVQGDAWPEFQTDAVTELAAVWERAQQAANVALTAGWHDPNGAGCSLSVWGMEP